MKLLVFICVIFSLAGCASSSLNAEKSSLSGVEYKGNAEKSPLSGVEYKGNAEKSPPGVVKPSFMKKLESVDACTPTDNRRIFSGHRNASDYSHARTILREMKAAHEQQCIDAGTSASCHSWDIVQRRIGSDKRKVLLSTLCW